MFSFTPLFAPASQRALLRIFSTPCSSAITEDAALATGESATLEDLTTLVSDQENEESAHPLESAMGAGREPPESRDSVTPPLRFGRST